MEKNDLFSKKAEWLPIFYNRLIDGEQKTWILCYTTQMKIIFAILWFYFESVLNFILSPTSLFKYSGIKMTFF